MDTIFNHIRNHLLGQKGMIPIKTKPSLESLKKTEWSPEFEKLMRNRLIMGAIRYGLLHEKGKPVYKKKLDAKYLPNKSQKGNIYLHFSKDVSYRDINIQIRKKVKIMEKFGLIKHSYKLFIPLESRDTEEHKGFGYLNQISFPCVEGFLF